MSRLKPNEIVVDSDFYRKMQDALNTSGWLVLPATGVVTHYDHSDTHLQAALKNHDELGVLDEVIDALGIRGDYEDVVTTSEHEYMVSWPYYRPSTMTVTLTDRGAQRFLNDIRAAKTTQLAKDATGRLAAALKAAKAVSHV